MKRKNKRIKNSRNLRYSEDKVDEQDIGAETNDTQATKKNVQKANHKKKQRRKEYSSENMKKAIAAVNEGCSYRKAGDKFGVPWPTLYRKLKLPERANARSGPSTVLEEQQEDEIVSWLHYRAERGYPVPKLELLKAVQLYVTDFEVENPFTRSKPGRHWYEGFLRRHPNVPIGPSRTKTLEQNTMTDKHLQEWFCKTKIFLRNKNLLDITASRVFNSDELSIQLCPNDDNSTTIAADVDKNKKSMTALFMYSADGIQAPPLIMYKYKNHVPTKVIKNCPSHWGIGLSENGGIVTKTYFEYITNVFYPWLLKQNSTFPIIVYLGKHATHVSVPLVVFCKEKNIELLALPPNFIHVIQPLNIALFHPFEDAWRKAVSAWEVQNNATKLNKEQFPIVLRITLDSLEEKNIIPEGFKAAGLVPFNPNVINYDTLKKKKYKTARNLVEIDSKSLISSELFQEEVHLRTFESNISRELLINFERCAATEIWTGDTDKRGMFEYWLKIKKAASVNPADNVAIVHCNKTINDSVILIKDNMQKDMDNISFNESDN